MTEAKNQRLIVRTADHRSHYIIGGIAAVTTDDIRIHLYNEVVSSSEGDYHISNAQLIMTRSSANRVLEALRGALSSEGSAPPTEVVAVPRDVAMGMDTIAQAPKKKVQKIRVK